MKKKKTLKQKSQITAKLIDLFTYLHNYINALNNSKLFAGLMIIVLNIASRFVTIKLSKSMESYLKYTFSRDALIFCIVWMGSRDIYIALSVMLVFILFMDFLFNESSSFCILPEHFMDYHINLLETNNNNSVPPSDDDMKNAKNILERVCNNVKSDDDKELCGKILDKTGRLFSNYHYRKNITAGNGNIPMTSNGNIINGPSEHEKDVDKDYFQQDKEYERDFLQEKDLEDQIDIIRSIN